MKTPDRSPWTLDCPPKAPRPNALAAVGARVWPWAVLLGLCGFLFFYRLAGRDLWSSHEGRAAQDAQSILNDGCWGLPRLFDGQIELQKPPLYYWLVAALAWLRGAAVDAWDVRLPAALAALASVLGLYGLALSRRRAVAGLVGAVVLATMHHYTTLARTGRIDMPLTLVIAVALGGFYLGQCRRRDHAGKGAWLCFLVAYLAVAAAVMFKGPIGAVLPAGVVVVSLLLEGELPAPWSLRRWLGLIHQLGLWWGVPLVLALAVPWFVWADFHTDGHLVRTFFLYHNLKRALGSGGLRSYPWWFYGPRLAVDLLPWTPLVAAAGWFLVRRGAWRQDQEARFGLAWLVTVVGILSCAGFKRADYLLPAYPGAALFLGCMVERWYQEVRFPRRVAVAFGLMIGGCLGGWWFYLEHFEPRQEAMHDYQRFATEIRRLAPAGETVVFFQVEAHALAFHVGGPLRTEVRWPVLDQWAAEPGTLYVVTRPECVSQWPTQLHSAQLESVLRNTDLCGGKHERPLVLMRTRHGP